MIRPLVRSLVQPLVRPLVGYADGAPTGPTFPARFTTDRWTLTDPNTDGDLVITILSQPHDGGDAITGTDYRFDGGPWINFTTSPHTITGLTNDQSYAVELRAKNSVADGLPSDIKSATPTAVATAPDAFTIGMWTLTNPDTDGDLQIDLLVMPYDGGDVIMYGHYRLDGGSWVIMPGVPRTITGLINNQSYAVEIRVGNSVGNSLPSDIKNATPTTAATAPSVFTAGMWTLTDLTTGGALQVGVTTLPSDMGISISALQYKVGAGSWTSLGGIVTGNYTISGLLDDALASVKIRAVNAVGNGADSDTKTATPTTAAAPSNGADVSLDFGITADYFVDETVAISGNGETEETAFKTLTEATDAAIVLGAGFTTDILVKAGIYREGPSLVGYVGDGLSIKGFGTDKPTVTGANVATGWIPCVAGDATLVGSNWANIYKLDIPSADLNPLIPPSALNLYEDGTAVPLVFDRLVDGDTFYPKFEQNWHQADTFGTGTNNFAYVQSAAVVSGGTGYSLDDLIPVVGGSGPSTAVLKVSGVTGGVIDSVSVPTDGDYTTIPTNPVSVSGGTGTGATFNLTYYDVIETVTDPSVLSAYTEAQILNAFAYIYASPNAAITADITAFNDSTDTFSVNINDVWQGSDPSNWLYALQNILPNMSVGRWGYNATLNGDLSRTIYLWPTNVSALTAGIEYSTREYCINSGNAGDITLRGLKLYQSGGDKNQTGICFGTSTNATVDAIDRRSNIDIQHCWLGKNSFGSIGYGAIYIACCNNLTIKNNTIHYVQQGKGLSVVKCNDVEIIGNHVFKSSGSPMRGYGGGGALTIKGWSERWIVAYNLLEDSGHDTHSNLMNFYQGMNDILVYGNVFKNCWGYFTWQETSNIFIGFNEIPSNRRPVVDPSDYDTRAIWDQNHTSDIEPDTTGLVMAWNNRSVPDQDHIADPKTCWHLGYTEDVTPPISSRPTNDIVVSYFNNITNGGPLDIVPDVNYDTHKNNVITAVVANQKTLDISELLTTNAEMYDSPTTGNFNPKNNGPAGKAGFDMSTIITTILQPKFPSFDFSKDINGDPFTWSNAFVGNADPGFDLVLAAPDPFIAGMWTITDLGTGGDARVNVSSLPLPNNDPLTGLEYTTDGGTNWAALGPAVVGDVDIPGLTDDIVTNVMIRAVNSIGSGANSDSKAVTTTTSSPAIIADTFSTNSDTFPNWLETYGTTTYDGAANQLDYVATEGANFKGTSLPVTVVDGTTYNVVANVTNECTSLTIDLAAGPSDNSFAWGVSETTDRVNANSTGDTLLTFTAVGTVAYITARIRGGTDANDKNFSLNSISITPV